MWIEIEVIPFGTKVSQTLVWYPACHQQDDEKKKPSVVFQVGRKAGEITFPQDKSVSRQHCQLEYHHHNSEDDNDNDDDNVGGGYFKLKNMGKGGSYVAVPSPPLGAKKTNDEMNNSDDEETDDEGISQPPQQQQQKGSQVDPLDVLPPIAPSVQAFWKNNSHTPVQLQKLGVSDEHTLDFTTSNKTILFQCGRFESTIKITWIPQEFTFSRLPAATLNRFKSQLPLLGGTFADVPKTETTTFLVTSERLGGAKQLIAWASHIPIVSPTYFEALLQRTSCSDPMPDPQKYPIPKTDAATFWDDVVANQTLLQRYTLISTESSFTELEQLAQAAGCTVVRLYHENNDQGEEDESSKMLATAQSHLDLGGCFMLSSRKKWSKKVFSLGVRAVSAKYLAKAVSQQNAELLQEGNGNPIQPRKLPVEEDENLPAANDADDDDDDAEKTDIEADDDDDEQAPSSRSKSKPPEPQEDTSTSAAAGGGTAKDPPVARRSSPRKRGRTAKLEPSEKKEPINKTAGGSSSTAVQLPPTKRSKRAATTSSTSRPKESSSETQQDVIAVGEESQTHSSSPSETQLPTFSRRRKAAETQDETSQEDTKEEEANEESVAAPIVDGGHDDDNDEVEEAEDAPDETPKMAKTTTTTTNAKQLSHKPDSKGWLTLAPKDDAQRRKLRQQASQALAREGGELRLFPAAETHVVSMPLRDHNDSTNSKAAPDNPFAHRSSRRRNGQPDFKKFCKNAFVSVAPADCIRLIVFRPGQSGSSGGARAGPASSEQQQELEEQERLLEEERRRADELFRGEGTKTVRRRRRL